MHHSELGQKYEMHSDPSSPEADKLFHRRSIHTIS